MYYGVLLAFCLLGFLSGVHNQEEPQCICFEEVLEDLRNPTILIHAGDGSGRRFVAEQLGIVWILQTNGTKLETPFLNISNIVSMPGFFDERGFLAMRFHQSYTENGLFYIYYSTIGSEEQMITRLSELSVMSDDPNQADHESERILLELDQPYFNHNGGEIIFLDDGTMLLFTGDGGGSGDPEDNSQDKMSLLGKTLRIDIDTTTGELPYGIPDDNPYLDDEDARDELYSIGLRNPWRATFDSGDRETGEDRGRILIADVGQNAWEEVNVMESGANYGWPAYEAYSCYREELCGNIGEVVWPISWYNHSEGQSVIGGHFYRGCEFPDMQGWYIFGDYGSGAQWRLLEDDEGEWHRRELKACDATQCPEGSTDEYPPVILSYGVDENNEIYLLSSLTAMPPTNPTGKVMKIIDPSNRDNDCP